ncbi:MAG: hypothetical protein IPK72_21195 [Candidatus Eisenbacteria bacterium]|nr:hypothetical protein [Candidatus Eisenbacteria bacterium]
MARAYREDAVAFVADILKVRMHPTLEEFLVAFQNNSRIARKGCYSSAKTFDAATAALWFLYTRHPAKVVTTAPSGRQVEKLLWSEINTLHSANAARLGGRCLTTELKLAPDWFAFGFAADQYNESGQQGFHSPNVCFIGDEAPGLAPIIFNLYRKFCANPGTDKALFIGNAINSATPFGACFTSPGWTKLTTRASDCINVKTGRLVIPGMVSLEWVLQMQKDYPPESAIYQMMVEAKFPEQSERGLIPTSWVLAAFERWLKLKGNPPSGDKRLGVDIARGGSDETVFTYRVGNFVIEQRAISTPDLAQLTDTLEAEARRGWGVALDVVGIGAGVYDQLRARGVSVQAHNGAERSNKKDRSGKLGFVNKRSEVYWSIRELLDPENARGNADANLLALPQDDKLLQELTAPDWSPVAGGKIKVEAKEDVKAKISRSPDRADSLTITETALPSGYLENLVAAMVQKQETTAPRTPRGRSDTMRGNY